MFQDFFKLFSPTIDDIISEWRHNLNSISSYFSLHPKQPETIPQASINMSDVIEVADAEQITGHINSILIQTPDRSTFVKGTCQEESKWWYNVLVQLVKSKVRHHKRNAFLKGQNQKCKLRSLISRIRFDWSVSRSRVAHSRRELCGNWVTQPDVCSELNSEHNEVSRKGIRWLEIFWIRECVRDIWRKC